MKRSLSVRRSKGRRDRAAFVTVTALPSWKAMQSTKVPILHGRVPNVPCFSIDKNTCPEMCQNPSRTSVLAGCQHPTIPRYRWKSEERPNVRGLCQACLFALLVLCVLKPWRRTRSLKKKPRQCSVRRTDQLTAL